MKKSILAIDLALGVTCSDRVWRRPEDDLPVTGKTMGKCCCDMKNRQSSITS